MSDPLFWLVLSFVFVTGCLLVVLVVAIPTLREVARAARSADRLFETLRRDFPPTLEALRMTGVELSDLTGELSEGVQSANSVARQVEQGVTSVRRQAQQVHTGTRSVAIGMKAAWRSLTNPRKSVPPRRPLEQLPPGRPGVEFSEAFSENLPQDRPQNRSQNNGRNGNNRAQAGGSRAREYRSSQWGDDDDYSAPALQNPAIAPNISPSAPNDSLRPAPDSALPLDQPPAGMQLAGDRPFTQPSLPQPLQMGSPVGAGDKSEWEPAQVTDV